MKFPGGKSGIDVSIAELSRGLNEGSAANVCV